MQTLVVPCADIAHIQAFTTHTSADAQALGNICSMLGQRADGSKQVVEKHTAQMGNMLCACVQAWQFTVLPVLSTWARLAAQACCCGLYGSLRPP